MKQHHQRADANVVGAVGETQQSDGGQMMNHLLSEVLVQKYKSTTLSTIKHRFFKYD